MILITDNKIRSVLKKVIKLELQTVRDCVLSACSRPNYMNTSNEILTNRPKLSNITSATNESCNKKN